MSVEVLAETAAAAAAAEVDVVVVVVAAEHVHATVVTKHFDLGKLKFYLLLKRGRRKWRYVCTGAVTCLSRFAIW